MSLILVVDDITALADQYAYDLRRLGLFETLTASDGQTAMDIVASEPVDVLILDLEMPGMDGFDVLRALKTAEIDLPVIVYTGTGNYARCVQAIKLGAYSFIDKNEPMEQVVREVENALEMARLEAEVRTLRRDLGTESDLLGSSAAMRDLKDRIARVAVIPSPVLIEGESGTGKELVAREIHRLADPAKRRPFVAVNCAALPENLVESELFGHERGAFTGANRTHRGAFEQASGGTLFLDEIGELPPAAQAKLLRVLENGEITRVGAEKTLSVNARIVAATNRDLDAMTSAGTFRTDLLYRLNVHMLAVPALRDRASDIPELAVHFLKQACSRFGMKQKRFSPDAIDALVSHPWRRNNVRELRNIVERMIIAGDRDVLGLPDIPRDVIDAADAPTPTGTTFQERKTEGERGIVNAALIRNDWHISNTAADLGLADHASLLKIMRRLGISRS